jgi:hypothetical protein
MNVTTLSLLIRSTVLFGIIAFSSLAPASPAAAQVSAPLPVLSSVVTIVEPGAIQVLGEGFTAGGEVFIAVLDPWGERSYETRWTTASEPTFDMQGHDDPALGYRPGGQVGEAFEHLCGQQVMVRAYDQATSAWSNVVDIVGAC